MRVLSRYVASQHDAGPKAKVDVERILKNKYNAKIFTYKMKNDKNTIFERIKKIIFYVLHFRKKEICIIQYPFINSTKLYKSNNCYALVHDLGYFRTNNVELLKKEIKILNNFKSVIVHNNTMDSFLKEHGLTVPTIILEFFDYLSNDVHNEVSHIDNRSIEIAYPGNWSKDKAKFLYDLNSNNMNFKINVYGPNKSKNTLNNSKIKYCGSFSPDEIIHKMQGIIGLVWSGELDDTDGDEGEKKYNKYNTPHKLSCFLAANMPVIVWEQSAISEVVKKYNIGYTISNIYDINNLDFSNYEEKKKNAEEIGKKIRDGYYTKKVINEILK